MFLAFSGPVLAEVVAMVRFRAPFRARAAMRYEGVLNGEAKPPMWMVAPSERSAIASSKVATVLSIKGSPPAKAAL